MKNKTMIMGLMLAVLLVVTLFSMSLASALTISSVSSSPNEIQPGEKVTVTLTIENNGNDEVTDVKISLNLNGASLPLAGGLQQVFPAVPFSPYQSSNEQTFEKIKEDGSKEAEFELLASSDADSGVYNIPVDISYTLNSAQKQDSGVISLIINAKPIISISSDTTGLIKGKSNELTIKIVNSGLGNAKLASIKVSSASGIKILGTDNFYIGDISKDDFDSVKLNLVVNENAPSIINLPLEVTYKDSRNKEYTQDATLSIKAYTQKEAASLGLLTISKTPYITGGIVGIIILYLIYRAVKKRKNKLKE